MQTQGGQMQVLQMPPGPPSQPQGHLGQLGRQQLQQLPPQHAPAQQSQSQQPPQLLTIQQQQQLAVTMQQQQQQLLPPQQQKQQVPMAASMQQYQHHPQQQLPHIQRHQHEQLQTLHDAARVHEKSAEQHAAPKAHHQMQHVQQLLPGMHQPMQLPSMVSSYAFPVLPHPVMPGNVSIAQQPSNPLQRSRQTPSRVPRWNISKEVLEVLEEIFKFDKFPTADMRRRMASDFGVAPRQIQFWFQNRRQRERRVSPAQVEEAQDGEEGEESSDSRTVLSAEKLSEILTAFHKSMEGKADPSDAPAAVSQSSAGPHKQPAMPQEQQSCQVLAPNGGNATAQQVLEQRWLQYAMMNHSHPAANGKQPHDDYMLRVMPHHGAKPAQAGISTGAAGQAAMPHAAVPMLSAPLVHAAGMQAGHPSLNCAATKAALLHPAATSMPSPAGAQPKVMQSFACAFPATR